MIYLTLIYVFFKIGLFSFGGGLAMLPLMERELVSRAWLNSHEFYNIVALAQATPGAIGTSMATYVGQKVGGVFGSMLATFCLDLPSYILIVFLYAVLLKFKDHPIKVSLFNGVKAASVALIFFACYSIGDKIYIINNKINPLVILVSIVTFLLLKYKKIHPIFILLTAGIIGTIIL